MIRFCHYIPYKYETGQTAAGGMPRFQRTASGPRTGRGPRQKTQIPLLTLMFRSMDEDAKGRGSRWGVTSRSKRPTSANRRQIWATGCVGHQPPEAVAGVSPWVCVLLVTSAGALGGLFNANMSGNGFAFPKRVEGVWCPGALWNVFVGGISALTSWALYGSGANIDLGGTPREQISLRLTALAGALVIGVAGSKWLTNEADKALLRESVVKAARRDLSPEECEELEKCRSPKKMLESVAKASRGRQRVG